MMQQISGRAPFPRREMSTRRKLLCAILTCILAFTAVEISWRICFGWNRDWRQTHRPHPTLGWCLLEGWHGKDEWTGGWSRFNAQGIRADDDVAPKKLGERRLLVLGDSVAFGAKVRTSDTFPNQLEARLHEEGRSWHVLNGGVTAYDPSQEADWLELFGWPLEPDVLAVAFCANDVNPSQRTSEGLFRSLGGVNQWLADHSLALHELRRWLWTVQARSIKNGEHESPRNAEYATPSGGWTFVEQAYRRIAAAAHARGVPVVLFVFPTIEEATFSQSDRSVRHLRGIAQELGWPLIDLTPAFQDSSADHLFLPNDPIHPSAEGYTRSAQLAAHHPDLRGLLP
jgi:lysophospholipase L1-like esterase